jgi:glutathione S-transferase
MELPAIVILLALIEYTIFSFRVGGGRQAHSVEAPATSGNSDWEKLHRVHQNTLEQLIVFIPSLWLFSTYWSPTVGAAIGAIFVIARPIYAMAYVKSPPSRTLGFVAGFLATTVLLLGARVGAIMSLL